MKRTTHTQLPEVNELKAIMEKEAWRDPAPGKENTHYPTFDTVADWLAFFYLDSDLFLKTSSWEEALVLGNEMREEIVHRTLENNSNSTLRNILQRATNYLGESDIPQPADIIFVFGSQNLSRIQKAVDLWKQRMAPKIFITGGHPYYKKSEPEAEIFKQYALDQGVPLDSIMIEPEAITIADNVRRSINVFEQDGIGYRKMILVTAWFVQRRSWAFMMKYIPSDYIVYRVNATVNPEGEYAPDRWFTNENGIRVIFGEFVKLKIGTLLNTA